MAHTYKLLRLISLVILTVVVMLGFFGVYSNASGQFSQITLAGFDANHGWEAEDITFLQRLSHRLNMDYVSFISEGKRFNIKNTELTPVYTTYSFFELTDAQFLYGSGFGEPQQEAGVRLAVISETLALELFFNTDAVGNVIDVDGRYYTVCGVIKDKTSIINKLSEDSDERVYLPYTCAFESDSLRLDTIIYDNHSNSAAIIEQMNLPQYYFFSLSQKSAVLESVVHVFCFVLYIALLLFALRITSRLSEYFLGKIQQSLADNYFFKSLRASPLSYLFFVISVAAVPVAAIWVFLISDFSVYIIPEYIPADNIFDLNFYFTAFLQSNAQANGVALAGDNYYFHLYNYTFTTLLWLFAAFIVLLIFTLTSARRFLFDKVELLKKA